MDWNRSERQVGEHTGLKCADRGIFPGQTGNLHAASASGRTGAEHVVAARGVDELRLCVDAVLLLIAFAAIPFQRPEPGAAAVEKIAVEIASPFGEEVFQQVAGHVEEVVAADSLEEIALRLPRRRRSSRR